jgi:hypothetical protein
MRNKSEGKHWASCTDSLSFSYSMALRTIHPPANLADILCLFDLYGPVHCKNILIYIQQDATLHSLFYLEIALHVSDGITTDHQERKQLYLQHLVFVTPLLLSAAMVEELELV